MDEEEDDEDEEARLVMDECDHSTKLKEQTQEVSINPGLDKTGVLVYFSRLEF